MKILSASQLREADDYTIKHEPVKSIALMERAATACSEWIRAKFKVETPFLVICGGGNNGGDGMAIARQLIQLGYDVRVRFLKFKVLSPDCATNLKRLKENKKTDIAELKNISEFPILRRNEVIIDAIFGTGISRMPEGISAQCIGRINEEGARIISIDLPSGFLPDETNQGSALIIQADETLTFQRPKLGMMFPENYKFLGKWHVLDIGLHPGYLSHVASKNLFVLESSVRNILKPRTVFSHKGMYGHALLISGSEGKMGAAVLAAHACVRSGSGLLSMMIPGCGNTIMQTSVPEAMLVKSGGEKYVSGNADWKKYTAIGIGPGMDTGSQQAETLQHLLRNYKGPLVLDADALNILGMNKAWLSLLPANSILTPHRKEFERLAGKTSNDFERNKMQKEFAATYKCIVVLKGAYTCTALPDGTCHFNSTGNPGMAKGGSGDALTGILLGLLAQGYQPADAAKLAVYLHGLAADIAVKYKTVYSLTPSDIIRYLPLAFRKIIS